MRSRAPLWAAALGGLIAVAVVGPALALVIEGVAAPGVVELISSSRMATAILTTAGLSIAVTAIAFPLGVWLAWSLDRRLHRRGSVLRSLILAPLALPPFLNAFVLATIAADVGFPVVGATPWRGIAVAIAALVLGTTPIVILVVEHGLARLDPAVEEVGVMLGERPLGILTRVVVPQLRRTLARALVLALLTPMADTAVASLLGVDTLGAAVLGAYRIGDPRAGAVYGLALVLLGVIVIGLTAPLAGRLFPIPPPPRGSSIDRSGEAAPRGAIVAAVLIGLVGAIVPIAVLASWSTQGGSQGASSALLGQAGRGSALVAAITVSVALVAALPVAVLRAREISPYAGIAGGMASAGYLVPGAVAAMGLLLGATRARPAALTSPVLLVGALVVRFLPQITSPLETALARLDPRFFQTARVLGRGRLDRALTVSLPLAWTSALAGVGIVALTALRDVAAGLILQPPGLELLGPQAFTAAATGREAQAAAAGLVLVGASALLLIPAAWRRPATVVLP